MKTLSQLLLFLTLCQTSFSMDYVPVRLSLYSRGEIILGEEFLTNDEKTVDYIATLKRPEPGSLKSIKYNCEVKMRNIRPSVEGGSISPPSQNQWVAVRMVYDLRGCIPAN